MTSYKIKNYIKLLRIRVDHFESHIVDEVNTDCTDEVEEFVELYSGRDGLKIIIIEMGNMDMITFDDVRRIIRNAHVFDYIRSLLADGHKMLTVDDMGGLKIGSFVKYMLDPK